MPVPAVTANDVRLAVETAVDALEQRLDRDWHAPAGRVAWTCWETLEHLSDALLFYATQLVPAREAIAGGYAFDYRPRHAGGPEGAVRVLPDAGPAGVLRVFHACGWILAATVDVAPPGTVARHMWGGSDAEGFAAMGVVETLAHLHDLTDALGVAWTPDEGLCDRVLHRLFPNAPRDTPRGDTLLWVTGRGDLPGRPHLVDWRWYGEPR